ncbi:MAG: archaemetzincin [Planctomycetota bacterium]|nr:archaemetzincin [Planctomycetota bacterium]
MTSPATPLANSRIHCGLLIALLIAVTIPVGWLVLAAANGRQPNGKPLPEKAKKLADLAERLRPLDRPMGPVQPGDWLESYTELGQTFRQYVTDRPGPVDPSRTTLYIVPLGEGTKEQTEIVSRTAEFLEVFFGKPVKTLERVVLDAVPPEAQRLRSDGKTRQLLSTWLLNDVLLKRRPKDAIAVLGMATDDLWPGKGWNFVFGQASLSERVGVWSLARNGDPSESPEDYRLCLRRTLKTAMHETGHMLGIPHCIAADCGMNGTNNREENDRRPIEFCRECQPKIWWYCQANPVERCRKLAKLAGQFGLDEEAKHFEAEAEALAKP